MPMDPSFGTLMYQLCTSSKKQGPTLRTPQIAEQEGGKGPDFRNYVGFGVPERLSLKSLSGAQPEA